MSKPDGIIKLTHINQGEFYIDADYIRVLMPSSVDAQAAVQIGVSMLHGNNMIFYHIRESLEECRERIRAGRNREVREDVETEPHDHGHSHKH